MLVAVAISVLSAAALPPECEPPALRDVLPLKQLSQLDGALSVGLDSVATWCFDPSGTWTAGVAAGPMKGKGKADVNAVPTGDCARAVASCDASLKAADKPALRELVVNALADFDRPFRAQTYTSKRSGLREKPSDKANCASRERTELFAMAQSRMDLARLAGMVQSEYSTYKSWLYARGLECRNEVAAAKKAASNTRLAVSIDARPERVAVDAGAMVQAPTLTPPAGATAAAGSPAATATSTAAAATVPGKAPGSSTAPTTLAAAPGPASWVTERENALNRPIVEKWKYLAEQTAQLEVDRDYTLGFLASRELRACDCTRVNPAAVVRSLEKKEGGAAGLAMIESEDGANTRCAVCTLDSFPAWKSRVSRQCNQMDELTDYELAQLEKSDDANGIPARCFDDSRQHRAAKAAAAALVAKQAPPAIDAGPALALMPMLPAGAAVSVQLNADGGSHIAAVGPAGAKPTGNPNLTTVNGMTYYRPVAPGAPVLAPSAADGGALLAASPGKPDGRSFEVPAATPTMTGPGVTAASPVENFVPPVAWAPIPPREDGRMYVRLSMSSACVAEIMPGPIQARTGDLLLVPYNAHQLSVKSPCGGLAEIYWGREARPRFSEVFGRNQAIKFEFKPQ